MTFRDVLQNEVSIFEVGNETVISDGCSLWTADTRQLSNVLDSFLVPSWSESQDDSSASFAYALVLKSVENLSESDPLRHAVALQKWKSREM
jgi:hypothetical protein